MWVKIVGLQPISCRKYAENAGRGWELSPVWSENQNRLTEKCHLKERNGKCFLNLFSSTFLSPQSNVNHKIKLSFTQKKCSVWPYEFPWVAQYGVRRVVPFLAPVPIPPTPDPPSFSSPLQSTKPKIYLCICLLAPLVWCVMIKSGFFVVLCACSVPSVQCPHSSAMLARVKGWWVAWRSWLGLKAIVDLGFLPGFLAKKCIWVLQENFFWKDIC